MEPSEADPCVFRKAVDGDVTLIICVHVDDLAVTAKNKEAFDVFYAQLKEEFPVNDMGDLSWHLGRTFERDKTEGVVEMRIFRTPPNHVWKWGHGSTAEK